MPNIGIFATISSWLIYVNMPLPWTSSGVSTPSIYTEISEHRVPQNRSAAQRRFSEFFSGSSDVSSRRGTRNYRTPKPAENDRPQLPPLTGLNISHFNNSGPILRSPTSIRSIIDPSASPMSRTRPLSTTTSDASVRGIRYPAQARVLDYGGNVPFEEVPMSLRG